MSLPRLFRKSSRALSLSLVLWATLFEVIHGRPSASALRSTRMTSRAGNGAAVDSDSESESASTTTLTTACAMPVRDSYNLGLHIAAIFVVLISSGVGISLPVFTKSAARPGSWWQEVFFVSKFFGTGIILATAFVHLLYEAFQDLSNECLNLSFGPTAPAITMAALMLIFMVDFALARHVHKRKKELAIAQLGRERQRAREGEPEIGEEGEGEGEGQFTGVLASASATSSSSPSQAQSPSPSPSRSQTQAQAQAPAQMQYEIPVLAQNLGSLPLPLGSEEHLEELKIKEEEEEGRREERQLAERAKELDVMILEGGIVFHSVMVGLGLGVAGDTGFVPYFVAIVFHQMFDGFAIGTRMAELNFTGKRTKQVMMMLIYTLITPLGITLGTIIRQSYDSSSPSTVLAIGTLNSMSAGVLLYGAIVDLLAKEFLFAKDSGGHGHGHGGGGGGGCAGEEGEVEVAKGMLDASWSRVASALGAVYMGAALMSLLGKWA